MNITIKQSGSFRHMESFLRRARQQTYLKKIEPYAAKGLQALQEATPLDSGNTANSWRYELYNNNDQYEIRYFNSNIVDGVPIAIILQCGHGTGTGGYVEGRDYINPALRPVFDEIAEIAWREVTR